jgi:predicted kinase
MLIVLSGLAGTGKSTLADGIAMALGLPVLSVDPIESAILGAGLTRSFETGLAAYLVTQTIADGCLGRGLACVIDAANYVEPGRDLWRALAHRHGAPMKVIVCSIADIDAHRARLSGRDRGLAFEEPTWDDVEAQRAHWVPWPEPHLVLDAGTSADDNLRVALAYLRSPS